MNMSNTTPQTNYDYFKQLWHDSAPTTKRKWRVFLAVLGVLWLGGAVTAFSSVAGIMRLGGGARPLTALLMGPFGLPWGFLKWTGLISETTQEPNLFWLLLLGLNVGIVWLVGKILTSEPNQLVQQQRKQAAAEKAQGRLPQAEIEEKLQIEAGVSAAQTAAGKKETVTVGLDYETGEGHVLAVGPTRSGKGLHLTQTLLMWPGAAIIVDPKGEQFQRTAGERQKRFGSPIYRLPGSQVHLSYYYDHLLDRDSLFELHHHLLRPWQSRERIFADKSRALFSAAAEFAKAFRLNPVRVLLDMADCDPVTVLTALETVPAAKKYVRLFTDGLPPAKYYDNRFATSAYGTFTTMLNGYQKHIDTIAPRRNGPTVIPRDWAAQGATIYITYSLSDLQGVGGVVAAIIAAFMRYQLRQPKKERVLFAIDELPAVGLYNVTDYLATVGGTGITLLLYAQAISQLRELYGREGTQSILANCVHQIWYPPADIETAKVMAELYGTAYKATHTHSTSRRFYQGGQGDNGQRQNYVDMRQGQGWEIRPVLEPGEIMSLPKEQVMVLTQKERQYRFFGERLNPIPLFPHLAPPPDVPQFRSGPRQYTSWQPDGRSATDLEQDGNGDSLASADHF
ncbi:MAG: hypothetical protein CL608_26265 [Anaerolineaceae bacterium]|nr:hypothetical protein [Anaerolineaceae bacterium]